VPAIRSSFAGVAVQKSTSDVLHSFANLGMMNVERGRRRQRLGRQCCHRSNRQADRDTTRNRRTDRPDRGPAGGGPRRVRANDIVGMRDQPCAVARHHPIIDCCHGHSPNVSRWVSAADLHLFQAAEDRSVLNATPVPTVPIYRRRCPKLVAPSELSNFDQHATQHRSRLTSAMVLSAPARSILRKPRSRGLRCRTGGGCSRRSSAACAGPYRWSSRSYAGS
jgi:hypothetical protein